MQSRGSLIFLMLLVLAMFITVAIYFNPQPRPRPAPPPTTTPATVPATAPTSLPTSRKSISTYSDFLTDLDPRFASATEESTAVPMVDAAAIPLKTPVYLDLRGDLWLTHPDAPPVTDLIATAGKSQLHISKDEVVFVFWSRNAKGNWIPQPVTRNKDTFIWHTPSGPHTLARADYRFEAALLLVDDRLLIPTRDGVAAIIPPKETATTSPQPSSRPATSPSLTESFAALSSGKTPVAVFPILQGRSPGAIAFRPWDNGDRGSDEAILFGTSGFESLPKDYLPSRLVHIYSYTDGSNLVLSAGEDASIDLEVIPPLSPQPIDENKINRLIGQLSSSNAQQFTEAQNELARYGPSAWPYIERVLDNPSSHLSDQTRATLIRILGARAKPQLGIFTLLPGPTRIITRTTDGSLALYCFGGVNYLDLGNETLRAPALLIARPGRPTILAPEKLTTALPADELNLQLLKDEILVLHPLKGILRLLGLNVTPLLKPEHGGFLNWVGTDRTGRMLFQNPKTRHHLLIDPNYLDPSPRLPAWLIRISDGYTGWDNENYPTIQKGDPWRLKTSSWEALTAPNQLVFDPPTTPTPAASVKPATSSVLPTKHDAMKLLRGSGELTSFSIWTETASIQAEGYLFLFDTPGKVRRFSRATLSSPWTQDAVFTKDLPKEGIRRIWLDPQNRICIAHNLNQLTILFPKGRVPPELVPLITNPSKDEN